MSLYTLRNSAFHLCMEDATNGTIYSQRLKVPLPFHGLSDLILKLDAILELQNFPQAFQRAHNLPNTRLNAERFVAEAPEEGMSPSAIAATEGKHLTLLLSIQSRRHSTWQGALSILPDGTSHAFSSVLELIQLIQIQLDAA